MGLSGSISAGLGTSLAGLLCGWGTAAPPPVVPPREAGCLGVLAGCSGPAGFWEDEPVVLLTQKYLWPNSDPGNRLTLPHTAGRADPWNAILLEQTG